VFGAGLGHFFVVDVQTEYGWFASLLGGRHTHATCGPSRALVVQKFGLVVTCEQNDVVVARFCSVTTGVRNALFHF